MENQISLASVELELMTILWDLGEGTVRDVQNKLTSQKAYTSVSTILRILEKKEFLASRKEGKTHYYYPLVKKETYQIATVRNLIDNVFSGMPTRLVQTLVNSEQVDVKELTLLLENLKKEQNK